MSFYDDILHSIKEEAKKYVDTEEDYKFYIIGETENCVSVHDEVEECTYRDYTITNPDVIDSQWIKDKIIVTDSVLDTKIGIDVKGLSDWLVENVDKKMYMNLENIIFLNDVEKDLVYLSELDPKFNEILECNSLPEDDAVGLMWYSNQIVLINIGTILSCEKELLDEGIIYDWELDDDVNAGICKTLVHEIRHLAVANPFLPEEFLGKTAADDEIDAEEYAEKICGNGVPYIIQKTDKELETYENDEPEI